MVWLWFSILLATPAARTQQADSSYRGTVLNIQQHLQSNDLDGARALLSAAFKRYPSDGGLENLLGVIEIQQGHAERAKLAFREAIQQSPRLVSAYLNLARVYMESSGNGANTGPNANAREQALHLYEKVEQLDPHNPEAAYQEATIFLWESKYQRSLQELQKLDAAAREQLRVQAIVCVDEAALQHKEAADRAAAAMVANVDFTEQDAFFVLPALRAAHRADLIDRLFSAASARRPLSSAGLRILGLAQEAEGKPEQARATLERVFALDNSAVGPLVDLTRIAIAGKDYQGALGYLAHARDLNPNDPALAYEFGIICMKMKLLGEALKAMSAAVKLAPQDPEYNFGMGTLMSFAQDPTQALPYLEKYHQLRPADAAGELALGAAYFQASNFETAATYLRKAAGEASTAAAAHYYLGSILRRQDQYDQAIRQLSNSVALQPDQPDAYAELGQVYMQMNDYPEAEKQLNHAIALDANCYAANFALLRLYSRTGDPRREQQSKRFEAIRDKNEARYTQAMRVIEARPQAALEENSPGMRAVSP